MSEKVILFCSKLSGSTSYYIAQNLDFFLSKKGIETDFIPLNLSIDNLKKCISQHSILIWFNQIYPRYQAFFNESLKFRHIILSVDDASLYLTSPHPNDSYWILAEGNSVKAFEKEYPNYRFFESAYGFDFRIRPVQNDPRIDISYVGTIMFPFQNIKNEELTKIQKFLAEFQNQNNHFSSLLSQAGFSAQEIQDQAYDYSRIIDVVNRLSILRLCKEMNVNFQFFGRIAGNESSPGFIWDLIRANGITREAALGIFQEVLNEYLNHKEPGLPQTIRKNFNLSSEEWEKKYLPEFRGFSQLKELCFPKPITLNEYIGMIKCFRGPLPLLKCPEIFKSSAINLNIHSCRSNRIFNLRELDCLGCGAFLITSHHPKLEEYFSDGKNLVWYRSISDLKEKMSFYLGKPEERAKIAKAGQKIVENEFRYDKKLIPLIEKIINES